MSDIHNTMATSPAPHQFLIRSSHLKFFTSFMLCGMMVFEIRSSGDALATFITLEVNFWSLICDLHFSILLWGSATLSLREKKKKQVISGSRITLSLEMHCKMRSKVSSFCQCVWDLQLNCNVLLQGDVEQMVDTFHLELQWGNAKIVMEFSIGNDEAPCYVMMLCHT